MNAPDWERNFYAMEDAGSGYVEPVRKPTKYRVTFSAQYITAAFSAINLTVSLAIRPEGESVIWTSGTLIPSNTNGVQTLTLEVTNTSDVRPSVMLLVQDNSSAAGQENQIECIYTIDSYVDFTIPA